MRITLSTTRRLTVVFLHQHAYGFPGWPAAAESGIIRIRLAPFPLLHCPLLLRPLLLRPLLLRRLRTA